MSRERWNGLFGGVGCRARERERESATSGEVIITRR